MEILDSSTRIKTKETHWESRKLIFIGCYIRMMTCARLNNTMLGITSPMKNTPRDNTREPKWTSSRRYLFLSDWWVRLSTIFFVPPVFLGKISETWDSTEGQVPLILMESLCFFCILLLTPFHTATESLNVSGGKGGSISHNAQTHWHLWRDGAHIKKCVN